MLNDEGELLQGYLKGFFSSFIIHHFIFNPFKHFTFLLSPINYRLLILSNWSRSHSISISLNKTLDFSRYSSA